MCSQKKSFVLIVLVVVAQAASCQLSDFPAFTAQGEVLCERFNPFNTNSLFKSEGRFSFFYSNRLWRIQYTYPTTGATVDCQRIPDGIRQIIIYTNLTKNRISISRPYATTQTIPFPSQSDNGLFLPWLSLCPRPELPIINSNLIHFLFLPQFLNNPQNQGGFDLSYIAPEDSFVRDLNVSNNGTFFNSDGSVAAYSKPYSSGFIQFSYKVEQTTNYSGINFPRRAVLREFMPLPGGGLKGELYTVLMTKLSVDRINIGERNSFFKSIPANLVVLDSRPTGISNGVTVNYEVVNDQWLSITNRKMRRLADGVRRQFRNEIEHDSSRSTIRLWFLCIIGVISLAPLSLFCLRKKK